MDVPELACSLCGNTPGQKPRGWLCLHRYNEKFPDPCPIQRLFPNVPPLRSGTLRICCPHLRNCGYAAGSTRKHRLRSNSLQWELEAHGTFHVRPSTRRGPKRRLSVHEETVLDVKRRRERLEEESQKLSKAITTYQKRVDQLLEDERRAGMKRSKPNLSLSVEMDLTTEGTGDRSGGSVTGVILVQTRAIDAQP